LIVIGSGTAALQSERGPSGYVLRLVDETCLLDGGAGTLLKCLQAGVSYRDFDRLFYTHLHPDHTIDLIPFLFATKNTPGFTRTKPLTIYGPCGFRSFYDRLLDLFGRGMVDVDYPIEIFELDETQIELDAFKLQSRLMAHADNAIGYRFQAEGKVFVYSGDTDYCQGIVDLARDADLLRLECSFPDALKVTNHLAPTLAGEIARQAGVRKLLLTHIYPPFDEREILDCAGRQFSGPIEIARDLMRIEV